jgi:hypothetical protein
MNIKLNNLVYKSNLSGSTGAKLFSNKSSNKYVVKKSEKGGGFNQVLIESYANDIYEALHIPVPKHKLDSKNKALLLEFIEGKELGDIYSNKKLFNKMKKEVGKGFVVDALLGNWDVIGLNMDNILVSNKNIPYRIDNGGTFTMRAQGKEKYFGKEVNEIFTMRGIPVNGIIGSENAIELFGDLTQKEINQQIKRVILPNKEKIISLTPSELKTVMNNRIDFLLSFIQTKRNKTIKTKIQKNKTRKQLTF